MKRETCKLCYARPAISSYSALLFGIGGNILMATLIVFLIYSCSSGDTKKEAGIYDVNILDAFNTNEDVSTSEFIDGTIEYIPLESKKEFFLDNAAQIFVTDLYIITLAKNQIYLFNRKTGKFIREIGHYGNDPGGYKRVVQAFPFDEKRKMIYTGGWDPKSYCRYPLSGEFAEKITAYSFDNKEDMSNGVFGEIITSIAPLNDTCFVGYVWNINGKQEAKLIAFNGNNHRIKIYPQYKRFDYDINRDGISVFSWNAKYYQLKDQLHFFERFTDTVFTVSIDTLQPKFVLHRGGTKNATATDFTKNKGNVGYFLIENIFESDRYLFFKIRSAKENFGGEFYYGFFDKANGRTEVSKNVAGINNDVDNFLPFRVQSANQYNEIIGSRDAYEVKLWFEENPEKATKLPPDLQKLKVLEETDNPVVMIAKLKR